MRSRCLCRMLAGLLFVAGCEQATPKPAPTPPPTPPSPNTAPPVVQPPPPPSPSGAPVAQAGTSTPNPAAPAGEIVDIGPFAATLPTGWVAETPQSRMRLAQFKLPAAEGDTAPTELVVFYFGAQGGGGKDANLKRWAGQFEGDPDALFAQATIEDKQLGAFAGTLFDLSGTFNPSPFPGQPPSGPKPNHRMRAAILETDQGLYFFKAVGPEKSVAAQAAAIEAFVASLKKK